MSRRFGALYDKWKILRGDKVKIIAGKDKGETGTIARVLRHQNRVIVEGFNLVRAWSGSGGRQQRADGCMLPSGEEAYQAHEGPRRRHRVHRGANSRV